MVLSTSKSLGRADDNIVASVAINVSDRLFRVLVHLGIVGIDRQARVLIGSRRGGRPQPFSGERDVWQLVVIQVSERETF